MAAAEEISVGEVVRALRQARGLSLRKLAAESGISASFISQVENGQVSPSISSLRRMAGALGATLGALFSSAGPDAPGPAQAAAPAGPPAVVLAPQRRRLVSSWSRAVIEGLSRAGTDQALESVMISFLPGGRSGNSLHAVPGEQFACVTSGEITLVLEAQTHTLHPGDAVTIGAGVPHR